MASAGRNYVSERLPSLIKENNVDFTIVNGENATHGRGLSLESADQLFEAGADVVTMGNHTWSNSSIEHFIDDYAIVRPANMHPSLPGRGCYIKETPKGGAAVIQLMGRVFMEPCENPFDECKRILDEMPEDVKFIIADFHGEATSEKAAFAHMFDGRLTAVIGTHTHVQTADQQVLPGGTAYITDVGMCGPVNGIIGMDSSNVVKKFVYNVPVRFEPAKGAAQLNAVLIEADDVTGRAISVERIYERQG